VMIVKRMPRNAFEIALVASARFGMMRMFVDPARGVFIVLFWRSFDLSCISPDANTKRPHRGPVIFA
jgi:hypothetical protein